LWIHIGYNNVSRTCMTRHGSGHYANGSCACYQNIIAHGSADAREHFDG
jgi:hypothetical protein